jgi:uncharacterized integral membrane protein
VATRTGSKRTSSGSGKATGSSKTTRRRVNSRIRAAGDVPIAEPTATVAADDAVLAASNARRALSPDMPRVAWLRSQLHQMEQRQRERLVKVAWLTLIAIIFITFVLQNAQPVNVHFLLFSLDIRLIWVIFGTGLLGGAAGYLIGRPDKSLRALLPQKDQPKQQQSAPRRPSAV